MSRYLIAFTLFLTLGACTDRGHPPLVNSGSYDWTDSYRGANGYPLPGWGP